MTQTIALHGLAGVEHARPDRTFQPYLPEDPVPMPIKAGDRVRVRLDVADDAWLYAAAVVRQAQYRQLGAWPPAAGDQTGARVLWPGGHVLTDEDAKMTSLIVVASSQELPWLRDLTRTDCSTLVGEPPPDPPKTPCDHLYGLFWKIQKQPRGLVAPTIELLQDGSSRIPAIVAQSAGSPYTALEWQFRPRS